MIKEALGMLLGMSCCFILFMIEVKNEVLKIHYPNYQTVMSYTAIIVIVSIFVGIVISIIDIIIYNLLKMLLLGIK